MGGTLYIFNIGLFEIQCQARVVTTKYASIIAVEFVYAERSYGTASWGGARTKLHEKSSVEFGMKVYGTAVTLTPLIRFIQSSVP